MIFCDRKCHPLQIFSSCNKIQEMTIIHYECTVLPNTMLCALYGLYKPGIQSLFSTESDDYNHIETMKVVIH